MQDAKYVAACKTNREVEAMSSAGDRDVYSGVLSEDSTERLESRSPKAVGSVAIVLGAAMFVLLSASTCYLHLEVARLADRLDKCHCSRSSPQPEEEHHGWKRNAEDPLRSRDQDSQSGVSCRFGW